MRVIWFILGAIALSFGVIGIALPIMPTVPFLIVAVWAFTKSSPRLKAKILNNPTYGPPIRKWQERGAIGRWAKIWAVGAMASGVAVTTYMGLPVLAIAAQALICTLVGIYVVTRPEA